MDEKKIRLGGMALENGVLVHGPTAWACAVRTDEGRLKVASGRKRVLPAEQPLLRGPVKLLESLLVLPAGAAVAARDAVRLPAAACPCRMALSAGVTRAIRATRLTPAVQELAAGAAALTPAMLALRQGELAGYHGAEHVTIGTLRAR